MAEDSQHWPARVFARCVLAALAVLAAVLLRWLLVPHVGAETRYFLAYPVVIGISLLFGIAPGMSGALLAVWATETWLNLPYGDLSISLSDAIRLGIMFCPVPLLGYVGRRFRARRAQTLQEIHEREQAEAALLAAVQRYEQQVRLFEGVASTTPDFVYVFDLQGRFLYANRRLLEVWGMQLPEVIGKTCRELGYEQWHHDMHMREIAQVIETRKPIKGEVPFKAPLTGVFGVYEYIFTPVVSPDGEVEFIAGTTRDVTERQREQAELVSQRKLLQAILDNIPVLLCIWDPELKTFRFNRHLREVLGWTEAEVDGDFLARVYPDPGYRRMVIEYMQSLEGGWRDLRTTTRDGAEVDISWANVRLSDGTGIGIGIDVRERKRAEHALRAKEAELREAQRLAHIGSWYWEVESDVSSGSDELLRIFGFDPVTERMPTFREQRGRCYPIEDWERLNAAVQQAVATGIGYNLDVRALRGGEEIWITTRSEVMRDAEGRVIGLRGTVQDITERKRAEEQLAAAKVAAESANRAKDHFLAVLSHELRTPLNSITLWAQFLKESEAGPDDQAKALADIDASVKVQTRLIEDLLDVSRIVSGKLEIRRESVDLARCAEAAVRALGSAAGAKGIALTLAPCEPAMVLGDAARLQQIVSNLLGNAVKFTPKGGRVDICVRATGGRAVLQVRDTGQGISPEFLPHIFDRFTQADASSRRRHGGLGLGLSIVRHLAEMHGGSVAAASPGEGQGATFTVHLPLASCGPTEMDEAVATSKSQDGEPAARLDGLRILVLDDEESAREALQRVLTRAGAEVLTAGTVDEALLRLETSTPHAVVSDIAMPGRDGFDFIRQLRGKAGVQAHMPVVALTAFSRLEDREQAIHHGFSGYCSKPVSAGELIATIAAVVADGMRPL